MNIKIELVVLLSVMIIQGCGKWPEIVDSEKDVISLSKNITSVRARGLPDDAIPSLIRLQNLEILDFGGGHKRMAARISNRGLGLLAGLQLPKLETLTLDHTDITDDGLIEVAKMKSIHWLSLMACPGITDNGLSYLVPMTNLVSLDLRGCKNITDKGVADLKRMPFLREVLLGGCESISIGAIKDLRESLPSCRVEKDDKEWLANQ